MYNLPLSGRTVSFENISQRVLYMPTRFFSPFKPIANIPADESAQQAFYSVLRNVLCDVYNNPASLALPESGDHAYPWYICNNQDSAADELFKSVFKETAAFYNFLLYSAADGKIENDRLCIQAADLRKRKIITKNYHIKLLEKHGVDCEIKDKTLAFSSRESSLICAWKALAEACLKNASADKILTGDAALFSFATANFACDYSSFTQKIEAMSSLAPGFFDAADSFYSGSGCIKNIRLDFNRNGISVCYRWQGSVSGFNISYQPRKREQIFFSINNGVGMKKMMENFSRMPPAIQAYFISAAKKCDNCLGCTKGGKASIFRVAAEYKGDHVYFCPQFPNLHFFTMDSPTMSLIMSINELQGKYR